MSYKQTVVENGDTRVTWNLTNAEGKLYYSRVDTDLGSDGVVDRYQSTHSTYNEAGLLSTSYQQVDWDGNGVFESQSLTTYSYDDLGRLVQERLDFPDTDGDGVADWSDVTNTVYTSTGQIDYVETTGYWNGVFTGIDYRIQDYTYNAQDQLVELRFDDWVSQDFEVAFFYQYNAFGQLSKVLLEDEYTFGDTRARTEETYKYNSSGQLSESNKYHREILNDSIVFEVKTKFSYWADGNVKSETITGQNESWQTVEKQYVEHWYWNGLETTRLTSFDENLDGKWDAGTRTLEKFAYDNSGTMISHTIDRNTGDGVIEYAMNIEYLPDDMLMV